MATYADQNSPTREAPSPRDSVPPPSAREPESTMGLVRKLIDELSTLVRGELALARAELREAFASAKTGAVALAAAGVVLFAAFLVLLSSAVLALAQVLPAWAAALIVGLIVGAIGYLMLRAGQKKLSPSVLEPTRTQESLRRDKDLFQRKHP